MKLVAKIKLLTTAEERVILGVTLRHCNDCANFIGAESWKAKALILGSIHRLTYRPARELSGLGSNAVCRAIKRVAEAYGRRKQFTRFRDNAAVPYNDKILSWNMAQNEVSIWTVGGRLRLKFAAGPRQTELLKARKGQSELIYHRGQFYIAAVCEVPEAVPEQVTEFLGIDLGVKQIVVDSDGGSFSGSGISNVRYRHRKLRGKLQKLGTKSAKRKLKFLSGRENRFSRDTNHCIAKQIVATAQRTKRGIALENLKGIRSRIRASRGQRTVLHSWAFYQLKTFILYKALLAGVVVAQVDPRNTSRECSACGHIEKANRLSQSHFQCRSCGFTCNADFNAATVIRGRAATDLPIAARSLQPQTLPA